MKIKIKKLREEAKIPGYAHPGDAGLDLYSCIDAEIAPGERVLIPTGLSIELPEGFVSLIWDKSGIALKGGVTCLGGVIEHTYRGEYGVLLLNTSREIYKVKKGEKVAQLLIQPIATAEIEISENLSDTKRGAGGFGSTGI